MASIASAAIACIIAVAPGVCVVIAHADTVSRADPPVPPGRDPGGWPVAMISAGIDYRDATIAARLARDGEGEIIGYDFADDDRRPFAASKNDSAMRAANIVLSEGQGTSLVVIRADMSAPASLARAIRYAAESPARIVVFVALADNTAVRDVVRAANQRFRNVLWIEPAVTPPAPTVSGATPSQSTIPDPAIDRETSHLTVAAALDASSGNRADITTAADIAVPLSSNEQSLSIDQRNDIASARLAALAARLRASAPDLSANAMRTAIMTLAASLPLLSDKASGAAANRTPIIFQPKRHFWLE